MLKKVLNLRYIQPSEFLVLEVTENFVKINVRKNSEEYLLQEVSCAWNLSVAESIVSLQEVLQDILLQEKMRELKYAIVKLNGGYIFTTHLSLPQMPDGELAEAIRWEKQHYLPWEESFCYSAYTKLDLQEQRQNILLAAVQKEVVQFWDNFLQKLGLTLIAVNLPNEEDVWRLNFLPQGKERLRKPLTKFYQAGTIACFLLTGVMLAGTYFLMWRSTESLDKVEQNLQDMQVWQARYELQEKQASAIARLQTELKVLEQKRVLWSETLPLIAESMPNEAWLTAVRQRDNLEIEVQGKTLDVSNLQQLMQNLEGGFQKVQLLATHTEEDNSEVGFTLLLGKGGSYEKVFGKNTSTK